MSFNVEDMLSDLSKKKERFNNRSDYNNRNQENTQNQNRNRENFNPNYKGRNFNPNYRGPGNFYRQNQNDRRQQFGRAREVEHTLNDMRRINPNSCRRLSEIFKTSDSRKNFDKDDIKEAVEMELMEFGMVFEATKVVRNKPWFLTNAIVSKVFAKKASKMATEDEKYIPVVNNIVNFFFSNKKAVSNAEEYQDLSDIYYTTFVSLNKKYISKIMEKLSVSEELAATMAIMVPKLEEEEGRNPMVIRSQTYALLNQLYSYAESTLNASGNPEVIVNLDNEEVIKNILKYLFKDNLQEAILAILLEKRENKQNFNDNQNAVWATITLVAIDILESLEKEQQKSIIAEYADRRKNNLEVARRISLKNGISKEDYPKIMKRIDKIISKNPDTEKCFEE